MSNTLAQNMQFIPAWIPIDINGAPQTGDIVNMEGFSHFTFVGINGDGTGAITYTLREQDTNSGGNAADLVVIKDYWEKTHATVFTGVGSFARTTQTAAATVVTTSNQVSMIVFTVEATALSAGFNYLSVNLSESMGGAVIDSGMYILHGTRYAEDIIATALA